MTAEEAYANRLAVLVRSDEQRNRHWCAGGGRVLAVRHPARMAGFHDPFLLWLARNFPALRRQVQLALLPAADVAVQGLGVLVPWLQDPVEAWSTAALRQACDLVERCAGQGIAVVNHPARLVHAGKRSTAERLAAIGVRTPRSLAIDPARPEAARAALPGTILVREDWHHGAASLYLPPDASIEVDAVAGFRRPIAVEFVDTRGVDGLFHKYRCLVAGDHAITMHHLAAPEWEVRGDNKRTTADLLAAEARHIRMPDPHRSVFQAARRALELDFVAFDYACLADGGIVVWEANPFPFLRFGPREPHLLYRDAAVHRAYAAMAGLYLDRAGLAVPEPIEMLRTYGAPGTDALLARLAVA